MEKITIFWHRRDLRLHDNAGLYHALGSSRPVLPLFIFDTDILDQLTDRKDARVEFIHDHVHALSRQLAELGAAIRVEHGKPFEIWKKLLHTLPIAEVYTNHDYEPYAIARDTQIKELLQSHGVEMKTFKDHVIFEKLEIAKDDGKPYTVFTPYSKKWKITLKNSLPQGEEDIASSPLWSSYPNGDRFSNFLKTTQDSIPGLGEMGFERAGITFPASEVMRDVIRNYDKTRNIPAIQGTSRLGVYFRFGVISIREKARHASRLNETFLNELIWRDFYAMILSNFPHVAGHAFRPEYDRIEWRYDETEFQQWCEGTTGYPLVDAGMRELASTGFMHNRVRMVAASFFTKHLLQDWRLGEAWFARKLLDFDLASNNGGWQWAAGCGTDAAPYFRVFNPVNQQEKFDKDYEYIKRWIPEFGTAKYPKSIVDHKFARERCLKTYKDALSQKS
jgi:deoxyribodipyrimidine photo-lyase